tara:strand:- start:621 stop:1379 length:759 start_codon:yes stop_codon:yes gene_type:complete
MKHIVSYSGGLGSFMTAYKVLQVVPKEDVVLLFTDTKTEDEDLYRFLEETSAYFKIPITTISDGRDVWEVFEDVRFMGNNRIDPCSRVLKRELARKWMEENHNPEDCVLYFGIGWDEIHRMDAISKNWAPYNTAAPLVDEPTDRRDIFSVLDSIDIKAPRLYELGFAHNNCGGFCIKTGQAQFLKLLKALPERYAHHEAAQEKLFKSIAPHGFIRVTINKKQKYMTLKEFREYVELDGQVDLFDIGGCGCFV